MDEEKDEKKTQPMHEKKENEFDILFSHIFFFFCYMTNSSINFQLLFKTQKRKKKSKILFH